MGTHMRVLSESFLMSTNMTGFRWFSIFFYILAQWTKVVSALKGLKRLGDCREDKHSVEFIHPIQVSAVAKFELGFRGFGDWTIHWVFEWLSKGTGIRTKNSSLFPIISLYKLLWIKPGFEGRMLNKPFASEIYLNGLTTHPLKLFSQNYLKYDHYNQHEN